MEHEHKNKERKKLSFYEFCVEINEKLGLESLTCAGIFVVKWNVTRHIIIDTEHLLSSSSSFFDNVFTGFIDNKQFLKHLKAHGELTFSFLLLV